MPKRLTSVLIISLLSLVTKAHALDPVFTPWLSDLAIRGYDPVAYFTQQTALEGSSEFEYVWQGATWRFTSAEHLEAFRTNPEAYAPQYGGYCAYAVAQNKTASVDPTQWSIMDGKLYLNYNEKIQQDWLKQAQTYIEAADENWPKLLNP